MPYELKMEWIELIKLLRDVDTVKFPRATTPKNAVGEPELIGYFDRSDIAYACVVYLQWILSDDFVELKLACSSSRVTPLKRLTRPGAELNGAVMLSRLVSTYSLSDSLPSKVWLFGDSECTLASFEKTSGVFGKYFGDRIGEIHEKQSRIEKFYKVGNGEWCYVPVRTMLLTDQQNSIQHMKMSRWTLHGKRVLLICICLSHNCQSTEILPQGKMTLLFQAMKF